MIPADRIAFSDEGTEAWWVAYHPVMLRPGCVGEGHAGVRSFDVRNLDRQCDTCRGSGAADVVRGICVFMCEVCDGTGRHTFEIEIATGEGWSSVTQQNKTRTHRVSVVPGMVLPVVELTEDECSSNPHVCVWRGMIDEMGGEPFDHWIYHDGDQETEITLPPDDVGDWAVQLKVHDR